MSDEYTRRVSKALMGGDDEPHRRDRRLDMRHIREAEGDETVPGKGGVAGFQGATDAWRDSEGAAGPEVYGADATDLQGIVDGLKQVLPALQKIKRDADMLDTVVREQIPDDIWEFLYAVPEGKLGEDVGDYGPTSSPVNFPATDDPDDLESDEADAIIQILKDHGIEVDLPTQQEISSYLSVAGAPGPVGEGSVEEGAGAVWMASISDFGPDDYGMVAVGGSQSEAIRLLRAKYAEFHAEHSDMLDAGLPHGNADWNEIAEALSGWVKEIPVGSVAETSMGDFGNAEFVRA